MVYGWLDELKKEAQALTSDVVAKATERAIRRVKHDLNTKYIEYIAEKTGHYNLAQACYGEFTSNGSDININIYYDPSFIEGFYKSNSSYHQDGGSWRVVRKNKGLSVYDFWEMHYSGETGGSYGTAEEDWIMYNFWNGREYVTNGWPLSKSEEYLRGRYIKVRSAYDAANEFVDQYEAAGHYARYVQEEMNIVTR